MRMRLIDAEPLKELFPDNGEGSWTYNATVKAYIDAQPTVQPETNCSEIPNNSDTISRQQAIDALRGYLVEKRCPDDGTLTCRLIENEVINKLPSAQPEPRTAYWTKDIVGSVVCSYCGGIREDNRIGHTQWCNCCGYFMRGEKK